VAVGVVSPTLVNPPTSLGSSAVVICSASITLHMARACWISSSRDAGDAASLKDGRSFAVAINAQLSSGIFSAPCRLLAR